MRSVSSQRPQGSPKEVVSVSNMGVSKRGPIIEARDRLLLEFTDGSACESDGLKLTYTTRIHLVCSRGSEVSRVEFSTFAPGAPHVSDTVSLSLQSMMLQFLTYHNCTANFRWETRAACAITTTTTSNTVSSPQ